jgi:hypothetical protein
VPELLGKTLRLDSATSLERMETFCLAMHRDRETGTNRDQFERGHAHGHLELKWCPIRPTLEVLLPCDSEGNGLQVQDKEVLLPCDSAGNGLQVQDKEVLLPCDSAGNGLQL